MATRRVGRASKARFGPRFELLSGLLVAVVIIIAMGRPRILHIANCWANGAVMPVVWESPVMTTKLGAVGIDSAIVDAG
jgi:hypothetical protein